MLFGNDLKSIQVQHNKKYQIEMVFKGLERGYEHFIHWWCLLLFLMLALRQTTGGPVS